MDVTQGYKIESYDKFKVVVEDEIVEGGNRIRKHVIELLNIRALHY